MRIFYYGLLRVVFFFAIWAAVYYLTNFGMIVALVVATILTFAVSYLFLTRLRLGAARDLQDAWEGRRGRRGRTEAADADAEDAYTEGRFRE